MLTHYIESLVDAIRRHEAIRKNAQLKSKQWTKSCFDIAADIIAGRLDQALSAAEKLKMGTTISPKTLSNMFKGEYRLAYPIDPRALNTLCKLVRFLGIPTWEDFAEQVDNQRGKLAVSEDPAVASAFVLREAIATEFRAYAGLPVVEPAMLDSHFSMGSPAFNRIVDTLVQFQEQGLCVSNPYNPSTYEILDFELLSADASQARFRTREYWLLCWWDAAAGRYVRRHKEIQEHFYTLSQTDEGWRVKANSSLADFADSSIENGLGETDPTEIIAAPAVNNKTKNSKKRAAAQV